MSGPAEPTPAPAPPAASPAPRRRGLWIALVASLAVNVFVLGWVASSYVYGPQFGPIARPGPGASGVAFQHRRALRALKSPDREIAERLWRENFPELRERVRVMRQAHFDMRAAFAADQADAKSLGDAVAAVKEKANAVFDHANATLLKIAAALPPAARKTYFSAGFPRPRERDRPQRTNQ